MNITVVVLTLNEERHIQRAISSTAEVAGRVIIVDSGSTDKTIEIAKNLGAEVFFNPFVSHARQFNWGLTQLNGETDWVLRIDADEYLTP